jgi:hypothetical protein
VNAPLVALSVVSPARDWSADEDERLIEMRRAGARYKEIGATFGRSPQACANRVQRLAWKAGAFDKAGLPKRPELAGDLAPDPLEVLEAQYEQMATSCLRLRERVISLFEAHSKRHAVAFDESMRVLLYGRSAASRYVMGRTRHPVGER